MSEMSHARGELSAIWKFYFVSLFKNLTLNFLQKWRQPSAKVQSPDIREEKRGERFKVRIVVCRDVTGWEVDSRIIARTLDFSTKSANTVVVGAPF